MIVCRCLEFTGMVALEHNWTCQGMLLLFKAFILFPQLPSSFHTISNFLPVVFSEKSVGHILRLRLIKAARGYNEKQGVHDGEIDAVQLNVISN